jgi:hypothetical protein
MLMRGGRGRLRFTPPAIAINKMFDKKLGCARSIYGITLARAHNFITTTLIRIYSFITAKSQPSNNSHTTAFSLCMCAWLSMSCAFEHMLAAIIQRQLLLTNLSGAVCVAEGKRGVPLGTFRGINDLLK